MAFLIVITSQLASLCYKSSVKSRKVVLDGFLTYNSSASECRLSDTENATFIFFRPPYGYTSNHCIFFNPGKYTIPAIGVLTFAIVLIAWYIHRKFHKKLDNEEHDARDLNNQINIPYSRDYGRESNRTSSQSSVIYDTIDIVEHARNYVTVPANDGNCEPSRYDVPVNTSVCEMYLTPGEITVDAEQVTVEDPAVSYV
uniref:Uncharacterized protein LOC111100663 n=1 Tax=Crassostrea virginica TaxID=6565 RepID=A0A8B8AAG9_CRAVI|nr:uncharacterized protein LOC111100663 [Crassostrea virginica]